MIVFRLFVVLINFVLMTWLYKGAAGTLSLKKLNLNSLVFYYLFVFCFVGSSLVFCGFRAHYLIQKCSEETLEKTYWFIMYTLLALPVGMRFFAKLIGIHSIQRFFIEYSEREILGVERKENSAFTLVFILTLIGGAALVYTIQKVGYIALFRLLLGNASVNVERQIATRGFSGNQYIRNLLALTLIPAISYIAYVYFRLTRQIKWGVLFAVLFVMSVLCKTYNYEKAPVVVYLLFFYIIEIMLNKVQSISKAFKYGGVGVALILLAYLLTSGSVGSVFSLSSGPTSRLFISQIATCYLHFQAFPLISPFLEGASFPRALSWLFGTAESGIRSGRIVMEIYNPSGFAAGVAGVMNTLFVGEAWANFGYAGLVIAPWLVALIITVIPCWILKQKKTPLMISLYVIISSSYANTLCGGFVDFIYNASLIFIVLVIVLIQIIIDGGKIHIKM